MLKSYWVGWAVGYVVSEQSAMWWWPMWLLCQPSPKNWVFGLFRLSLTLGSGFGACWDRGLWTWTRAWQLNTDSEQKPGRHLDCRVLWVRMTWGNPGDVAWPWPRPHIPPLVRPRSLLWLADESQARALIGPWALMSGACQAPGHPHRRAPENNSGLRSRVMWCLPG